jgi:hypothetical protein
MYRTTETSLLASSPGSVDSNSEDGSKEQKIDAMSPRENEVIRRGKKRRADEEKYACFD